MLRIGKMQTPVWLVPGITPGPCPLGAGLTCDIPITKATLMNHEKSCHSGGKCLGHNHPNAAVSAQAKEELDYHSAH